MRNEEVPCEHAKKKRKRYIEKESDAMGRKTKEKALIMWSWWRVGCERQMEKTGASVFSSCLLAHTLTTRLRPLWLSLFVFLSLSFHFIFPLSLSPYLALSSQHITSVLQASSSMYCMTFSNHPVKNTPTPLLIHTFTPWLTIHHTTITLPSKCVTHVTCTEWIYK